MFLVMHPSSLVVTSFPGLRTIHLLITCNILVASFPPLFLHAVSDQKLDSDFG